MKRKYIQITKGEVEGRCVPSALPIWKRNGWTVVDDGDSEDGAESPAPDSAEPVEVYDLPGLVVIPDDLQDEE